MENKLMTEFDSRNSFYGKANVRTENNKTILRSYSTDVAYIENGKAIVNGMYSNTTLRHIKEFLLQNGFTADNWKQIEQDYTQTKEQREKEHELKKDKNDSMLNTVGMVAKLGDIFCEGKKEKNDWKLRMLKAGLENKGLMIPEDWDELDEDTKQARLDGVIKIMKEKK